MAKFFLVLTIAFSFLSNVKAQNQESKILIQEYIKRSEQQKKTGLIMLGAGVGSVILGTVLFGVGWSDGNNAAGVSGVLLASAGSISTLVSIPILVSSASNGRKAAKLGISTSQIGDGLPTGFSTKTYPALSFSIPFNSKNP
ncbi:hypothetical protein [Algoriphagus litoralis]|uniref:hypothetical protein n=1 Tax=Algoriphagus litoralis TaxID=2202829 RepID=UPI000DB9ED9A|nr:hypothetical protein [Algoriphagus litoralis]